MRRQKNEVITRRSHSLTRCYCTFIERPGVMWTTGDVSLCSQSSDAYK